MQDLRDCLVLVATILSTYFNRDEEIDDYLDTYNNEFPQAEELNAQIDACFDFIRSLRLPQGSRAYRKTDLFSLLVEVRRAMFERKVALNAGDVSERLQEFFGQVDQAAAATGNEELARLYYRSTVRAAIDRGNRYRRGEILQGILDPTYTPNLRFAPPATDAQEQVQFDLEEGDY